MFDRKAHWQTVYRGKSPLEVSWYQQEPAVSLELIGKCDIAFDAPIIDVGGGASLLVDHLCSAGFTNISVLDISANALESAKARLGAEADRITWCETDVTEFNTPHPFQLWHDRAVFHFLTEAEDRKRYVDVVKESLELGGHLIIAAFAPDGPTQCSGLDIIQYDAEKLCGELGDTFSLAEERVELHITPAQKEQKFNYFRFVRIGC